MTTPVAYISGSVPVDIFFTTAPRYYAALQALHTHEPRRGETAAVTSAAQHPNEAISSDDRERGQKCNRPTDCTRPLSNLGAANYAVSATPVNHPAGGRTGGRHGVKPYNMHHCQPHTAPAAATASATFATTVMRKQHTQLDSIIRHATVNILKPPMQS